MSWQAFINGYLVENGKTILPVATLVRCLTSFTIGFPANHSGVIIIPVTILLRPLAKPVHFTIRKSAKVRHACEESQKETSSFNHRRT
ncbi:hypothetical protein ACTGUP_09000 [Streptococcus suis]